MLTSDDQLTTQLSALYRESGQSVPLKSLTGFEWDEFGFVPEGTPAAQIEEVFGQRLTQDKFYLNSTNLFVFKKDGQVVRAIMLPLDVFQAADSRQLFPNTVKVEKEQGKQQLLRFTL